MENKPDKKQPKSKLNHKRRHTEKWEEGRQKGKREKNKQINSTKGFLSFLLLKLYNKKMLCERGAQGERQRVEPKEFQNGSRRSSEKLSIMVTQQVRA